MKLYIIYIIYIYFFFFFIFNFNFFFFFFLKKELSDKNPEVRALAIKVMSSIRSK